MPAFANSRASQVFASHRANSDPRPIAAPGEPAGVTDASESTPSSGANWPSAISRAAPVVNPLITGRLRKLERKPSRNRPDRNSTAPAISASWAARVAYSADPAGASPASAEATINAVMAAGPIDCTMLLPNIA